MHAHHTIPMDIEALWEFSDPEGTERKFRELLSTEDNVGKSILWTQIARTFSLRGMMGEAQCALKNATDDADVVQVRVALEQGRIFNSSGQPQKAVPCFARAMEMSHDLAYLRLDAIHMLAISDVPNAISWAEKGIGLALKSQDEKVRCWIGPLTNNLGWTYMDAGDPERALEYFEISLEERVRQGIPKPIEIAKEAIAEAKRAMER